MKRRLRSANPRVRKTLIRDAHVPDTVYVNVETFDADVIEHNKRLRNAGLLKVGSRFPAVDDHAEVTAHFHFPSVTDYQLARSKYPDVFADLDLGGDASVRAGERLALLLPQYVTTVKARDTISIPGGSDAR